MRQHTTCFLFALLFTGTVTIAQDVGPTTNTTVKSDNGKVVKAVGCVMIGGATNFLLANVTPEPGKHDKTTSPGGGSYALVERDGLDLSVYIDHRVELTGVVVPAATRGDRDDKIKIKETTAAEDEPSKKPPPTTIKVPRGATSQFLVASVKTLAPKCGG